MFKWMCLILSISVFGLALWCYNTPGFIGMAVSLQLLHSTLFGLFIYMDYRERWGRFEARKKTMGPSGAEE